MKKRLVLLLQHPKCADQRLLPRAAAKQSASKRHKGCSAAAFSFFVSIIFFLAGSLSAVAQRNVSVTSVSSLYSAVGQADPGDKILLADGEYKNVKLVITRSGTSAKPIYVVAQNPGNVFFTGDAKVELRGTYIVLEGITFKNGARKTSEWASQGPGLVAMYASYNRITRCVFDNFDQANSAWVSTSLDAGGNVPLYCRIDHCSFTGKTTLDQVINLNNMATKTVTGPGGPPMYHRVDHNFFSNPPKVGNAGGAIRIGFYRNDTGRCLVDSNLFVRQDSEPEIITSKSQENVFYANTFINCRGTMNFRHGDHQVAINNFFIGNDTKFGYGGMFVWGSRHVIAGNYFQLAKTLAPRGNAALYLNPGPEASEHSLAFDLLITNNLFVNNNGYAIHFNPLDAERKQFATDNGLLFQTPHDIRLSGNAFYSNGATSYNFFKNDYEGDSNIVWKQNLAYGKPLGIAADTGIHQDPFAVEQSTGIYRPDGSSGYQLAISSGIANITGINLNINNLVNEGIKGQPLSFSDVGPGWLTEMPYYAQTGSLDFNLIIQNVIAEEKYGLKSNSTSINAGTTTLMANMASDGSFSDLSYSAPPAGDVPYNTHLSRLRQMALAYTFNGGMYYNDATLYNKIVLGLQYWNNQGYVANNWYNNQIGYPQLLGQFLILMRGSSGTTQLPASDEASAINYLSTRDDPATQTGANQVDEALHWIYRGALTVDAAAVANGLANVQATMTTVNSGQEGVNPDYGFLQHNSQLMIQGYGADYLNSVYDAGMYLAGTSYTFTQAQLDVVYRFAHHTFYAALRGKYKDFSLDGRGISRPNNGTINANIARKAQVVDPVHASEFNADSLRAAEKQPPPFQVATPYHIHYWTGDYTLHNRPAYSFSVRSNSTRTVKTETMNGENLLGKWLSDGATTIRVQGGEYYNIFPVWDWNMVPGITMRQYATPETNTNGVNSYGSTAFVGGVSDSLYGASVYQQNDGGVTATKSWFFFDNEVVCLGAGIGSSGSEQVVTTVNQALLTGNVSFKENGTITTMPANTQKAFGGIAPGWIYQNGVGYYFPSGGDIIVSNENQTGKWSLIKTGASSTSINSDVFKLWINHGAAPAGESYAYVVVPGLADATAMEAYDQGAIQILSNTAAIQAVKHQGLNMVQVIFSAAGILNIPGAELTSISVDKPCAVLLKDINSASVSASIADPTQQSSTIKLTMNFANSPQKTIVVALPSGNQKGASIQVDRGALNPVQPSAVLAVLRIGGVNGANGMAGKSNLATGGTPVHIDKYRVENGAITYLSSTDLNAGAAGDKFFMSSSNNEGYLTLSQNRQYLSFMGYAFKPASGNIYNATDNPDIPRTLGLMRYDGTVDLSTALSNFPVSGTAATPHASITDNGTDLWAVSNGGTNFGVLYTQAGTTNAAAAPTDIVASDLIRSRSIGIFGNNLYYAGASGNRVGMVAFDGLPANSGTSMTGLSLAGGATSFTAFSPSQMVMFDMDITVPGMDVMYITNFSTAAGQSGIYKYCKQANGSWMSYGTFGSAVGPEGPYFGITGELVNGVPVLYVTRGYSNAAAGNLATNQILQIGENAGYNAAMDASVLASIDATASGLEGSLRGIAFFPSESFYYKGIGNVNEVANWGVNPDGSGTAPTGFTKDNQLFFITNNTGASFGGNLTISGAGSKLIIGNGKTPVSFTIPQAYTVNATVDVYHNGNLMMQQAALPSLHYLATTSTVTYAGTGSQAVRNMAYGNWRNSTGNTATLNGAVTITGTIAQNGVLSGNGKIIAANGFTNSGTLAPGVNAGLFTVDGTFANAPAGTLQMELGGAAIAGTDYDRLEITGSATLDGTLSIELIDGFVPGAGQTFTILTAGTVSGTFQNVVWPAGVSGTINYGANQVTLQITGVLPLQLVAFTASLLQNGKVQLAWKTAGEEGVDKFIVERSTGAGSSYKYLNTVAATGTGGHRYSLTDATPASGKNIYRLKMLDVDGRYHYSRSVVVNAFKNGTKLLVYPNPVSKTLTLVHSAMSSESIITINSVEGKTLLTRRAAAGSVQTTIDIGALNPGWYVVSTNNGGKFESISFYKQ